MTILEEKTSAEAAPASSIRELSTQTETNDTYITYVAHLESCGIAVPEVTNRNLSFFTLNSVGFIYETAKQEQSRRQQVALEGDMPMPVFPIFSVRARSTLREVEYRLGAQRTTLEAEQKIVNPLLKNIGPRSFEISLIKAIECCIKEVPNSAIALRGISRLYIAYGHSIKESLAAAQQSITPTSVKQRNR